MLIADGGRVGSYVLVVDAEPLCDLVRRPIRCSIVVLVGHRGLQTPASATAYVGMPADDALARSRKQLPCRAVFELQMMARDIFR